MRRLSNANVETLPADVRRPSYDRSTQRTGIVHFGIGAFHRAHQAVYTDDAMAAGDRDWAISGVSLRSPDVRDALQPQDGLYSVAERDSAGERLRVIGSVREVLVGSDDAERIVATLASAHVHIATFTVTEKGYLRDPDTGSLLTTAADLAHDLQGDAAPRTIYGFLERGLARRRAAGLPGMTLMSCDNLASNGRQLAALLDEFLERRDPALAQWARNENSYPCTMIDRIVPATAASDIARIAGVLGCEDRAAVVTERFSQWVIEDRFAGPRPKWEVGGAQLAADVRPFETAKLRMLNGAHSALAYVGLGLGLEYVHQAIADPELNALVRRIMKEGAASLAPAPAQDLVAYAETLEHRFANPSLGHRLIQIAMDGTQKIPQRWLAPIAALVKQGWQPTGLLFALAGWIAFTCTGQRKLDDPLAGRLAEIRERSSDARSAVSAIVGANGLFSAAWQADSATLHVIEAQVAAIAQLGMRRALTQMLAATRPK
ncbi:MAG TPA: mannitol dehydrogenase family protein [Steroidobacteraceae bacterium]|nr:mannitol dehydrogenase family protein [Steroidobacteraceae bacterium]